MDLLISPGKTLVTFASRYVKLVATSWSTEKRRISSTNSSCLRSTFHLLRYALTVNCCVMITNFSLVSLQLCCICYGKTSADKAASDRALIAKNLTTSATVSWQLITTDRKTQNHRYRLAITGHASLLFTSGMRKAGTRFLWLKSCRHNWSVDTVLTVVQLAALGPHPAHDYPPENVVHRPVFCCHFYLLCVVNK